MALVSKRTAALTAIAALAIGMTSIHPLRATAQGSGGGAFGAGNGPIDISSDEFELVAAENRAIFRGNVEAIQGGNRMRTPVLRVFYAKGASANGGTATTIQRMEADGPVYYVTAQQNARGDRATYEAGSNTMILTGNVVLVQDKNVMQGDKLTVDTKTNHSVLVSTKTTRTRGVFYPSQDGQASPAPARP